MMIHLRAPTEKDTEQISLLLDSLGYPGTEAFIHRRLSQMLIHPDEILLLAEQSGQVLGLLSLHFIPQLALAGDFCRISYFCVAEDARGQGIGNLLEAKAESLARARNCDRIEVHCHARRVDAHRFYARQGYLESPKYLCKLL